VNQVRQIRYAGQLQYYRKEWKSITCDKEVLSILKGLKLNFKAEPIQLEEPNPINFNDAEAQAIDKAIQKLRTIGAIDQVSDSSEQFISNSFA